MKKAKLQTLDIHDYKPLKRRRDVAISLFAIAICFTLYVLLIDIQWLQMLTRIVEASYATKTQTVALEDHETLMDNVSTFYNAFIVIAMIGFCLWLYRSCYNSYTLSIKDIDFTPREALLWMLIPIANFRKPYQCLSQLYRGSQNPYKWRQITISPLFRVGRILIMLITFFIVTEWHLKREQSPTFSDNVWLGKIYICHDLVAIGWFVVLIIMMHQISALQMKRAEELTLRATEYVK